MCVWESREEHTLAGKRVGRRFRITLAENAKDRRAGIEDDCEGLGGGADGHVDEIPEKLLHFAQRDGVGKKTKEPYCVLRLFMTATVSEAMGGPG